MFMVIWLFWVLYMIVRVIKLEKLLRSNIKEFLLYLVLLENEMCYKVVVVNQCYNDVS